jgi:hypothetical protein
MPSLLQQSAGLQYLLGPEESRCILSLHPNRRHNCLLHALLLQCANARWFWNGLVGCSGSHCFLSFELGPL